MPILATKIIFSDEAHFDLCGYVNNQTCPIWGTENPHAYIEEGDIGNIWHTAEATLDALRPVFADRIISRRADVVWPPLSRDLTPLVYYLCGAVKYKCYADKPETIDALKDNIREAIGEIQLHTIDNVLKNWTDRVSYSMANQGSHLNEIIFQS